MQDSAAPTRSDPSVLNILEPLAALLKEHRRDVDRLIEDVLSLLARSLDAGVVYLARLEGPSLHIVQAYDRAGMGMRSGDDVPLCDTY